MLLKITAIPEKILVGKHLPMSLAENKTTALWRGFMPYKKLIGHTLEAFLYSVQVYPEGVPFTYSSIFIKWAAVEVTEVSEIPKELEVLKIPAGLYAVFLHKGSSANFAATMKYILDDWLPISTYSLDSRPHFECLGAKYKNNDPSSEEEVWIPIKEKAQ